MLLGRILARLYIKRCLFSIVRLVCPTVLPDVMENQPFALRQSTSSVQEDEGKTPGGIASQTKQQQTQTFLLVHACTALDNSSAL